MGAPGVPMIDRSGQQLWVQPTDCKAALADGAEMLHEMRDQKGQNYYVRQSDLGNAFRDGWIPAQSSMQAPQAFAQSLSKMSPTEMANQALAQQNLPSVAPTPAERRPTARQAARAVAQTHANIPNQPLVPAEAENPELPGSFEGKPENVGEGRAMSVLNIPTLLATGKTFREVVAEQTRQNRDQGRPWLEGAGNAGANFIDSMTTPETLATLGIFKGIQGVTPLLRATQFGAGTYFGGKMAVGAAQDTKAAYDAAKHGDTSGAVEHGLGAVFNAAMAADTAHGLAKATPGMLNDVIRPSVEEMTGTTPARLAELREFPQRVEGVRQTVIQAEKAAHQAASDAFPKFDQPIKTGRNVRQLESTGAVDEFGDVATERYVPETTTFQALQEQRSALLKNIAAEQRAVNAGAKPRFDLSAMYDELRGLDETMNKAALDQGGQAGLDQLNAARQQFSKYMQDFHNPGSPLRGMLEAKPGATDAIVKQLINPDTGARALETLRGYGVDTSQIESILQQGNRPLRVTSVESAKLRKAGNEDAYTTQRLREAVSQATTNELPSTAEARLPASVMRNRWPSLIGEVPGANIANPRKVTAWRLKQALKERTQK